MKQAPDWTKEEFELLIQNSTLSDESLAVRLPRRTLGAIQAVRSGVVGWVGADGAKMGKGVTLRKEELLALKELLNKMDL